MKEIIRKYLDYFLLGVLSAIPILAVVQIVVLFERLLVSHQARKIYVMSLMESYLEKVPLLSTVYRVTKKLINIFSGEGKKAPQSNSWVPDQQYE